LLVTADPDLLDLLLQLTAGAGVEVDVAPHPAAAGRCGRSAPVVLVGADQAAGLARQPLPRRRGAVLVGSAAGVDEAVTLRGAVDLGVDAVVALPAGEQRLLRLLALQRSEDLAGTVVAVVGGRGGAGCSVLAAALCVAAARASGRPLLVDADPWGGGADLLLGADQVPGLRWPELCDLSGPVSGPSLPDALPHRDGVAVVSWDRGSPIDLPAAAVVSVLEAGARGYDLVVVDLPRRADGVGAAVLARADWCLLVVPAELRSVVGAARTLDALGPGGQVGVVVRTGRGRGLDPEAVAATLGRPLLAVVADDSRLAAGLAAGDTPGSRSRSVLGRTAAALADRLTETGGAPGTGGAP
jgi:secretion/DNA translocation related CpaE-like protein